MSLSSLLLGGLQASTSQSSQSVQVDDELDALFRSSMSRQPIPPAASYSAEAGSRLLSDTSSTKASATKGLKRKRQQQANRDRPRTSPKAIGLNIPSSSKKRKSAPVVDVKEGGASDDEVENDASLEDSYISRGTYQSPTTKQEGKGVSESESSEEDDEDAPPPVHETHAEHRGKNNRAKSQKRVKYVPPDETPAQRDARTVFVGNIPLAVAKSKSSQKQLKRHFLSLVIGSRIESVRFRSVAFASATTVFPTEDSKTSLSQRGNALSTKQQHQHDRAARWRESTGTDGKPTRKGSQKDDDEGSDREDSHAAAKKTSNLTPAERKRVAFIKGEFHKEVDTVNAYIVFAYTEAGYGHELTAGQAVPFEAARLAVEQYDGSLFMDRTIRVDRVGQWRVGIDDKSGGGGDGGLVSDPRATLFVGNLDFAAKEEELRVWFEGIVSQERGPPPASARGAGEDNNSDEGKDGDGGRGRGAQERRRWVRSLRIVRDRETQLGKGFAYVRFVDRECVDEILGLEPSKLKFAKRKLRVQRCKVVPSPTVVPRTQQNSTPAVFPRTKNTTAAPVMPLPKGDPSLGEKLAGLCKDDRKAAKAANVDRVQRRLAKKKIKESVKKAQSGKDRTRERARAQNKGVGKAKAVNRRRIRSEQSMAKRNAKK